MNTKPLSVSIVIVTLALISSPATAQILYGPDQMTNAATWGLNVGGTADSSATFNYDYSADGILEAPNTQGGDTATRGVKLEANIVDPAAGEFFTLYPIGENFTGPHQLRFDAWMNFDADEAAGAAVGTTEFLGGGIGYDNATADIASGAQAMATGEGGSANDWRAFKSPPQFFIDDSEMAAGTHQGSDPYYADFLPALAAPAVQAQTASGIAGSPGFQWITWEFTSTGDGLVRVDIEKPNGDRLRIVDIDCNDTSDGSNGCPTEGNISLFYADFFTSVSPRPDLTFGIIDNVVVSVPDPIAGCDFDASGSCGIEDLDAMVSEGPIAPGVPVTIGVNDQFDLTGDGTIDLDDLDQWLTDAATENSLGSPYKLGDANLDSFVDGQDFLVWNLAKFTSSLLWSDGNFNGDTAVDGQDFLEWNTNKFTSSDLGSVPEPASGVLSVVGLLLLGVATRSTPASISGRS